MYCASSQTDRAQPGHPDVEAMSIARIRVVWITVSVAGVLLAAGAIWALHMHRVATAVDNGVVAFKKGDYAQAISILAPLAERGNATAQLTMGTMYAFGSGVARDRTKASALLAESLDERTGEFYLWVARSFETGDGVAKDEAEAQEWYKLAAHVGNEEAKKALQRPLL